jgi:Rad3-related DNA helicase
MKVDGLEDRCGKISKEGFRERRSNGDGRKQEVALEVKTEKSKKALPGEIHISVRGLVEFILRHGDIENHHQGAPDNAMQEGGRIHRMIQRRMGSEYQAEVPLKYISAEKGYLLVVEGRADGIIHQKDQVIIDEIKGTYHELAKMREPVTLHLAQAKCYAYMFGISQELTQVQVRMTYCNLYSEELRYFYQNYTMKELEEWFGDLLSAFRKWADYDWEWRGIRQTSIEGLAFPFPYRAGQKELAANVYKTIYHKKKLFLEAPTGVGKTISTIYPAVQAMGKGMGDKLFYLTAKTITRTVAEDTLNLLRKKGLRLKSVILTAKEKICFMEKTDCNPEFCPFARGHYDRINEAVYDLLTMEECFSREKIEEYARKHQVCPFEMCLDMSLYADAIICDYNYLFDPHIYLRRFFGENSRNYIFLIDEAHNLLERGREMYSAALWKEQFTDLLKEIKEICVSERKKSKKNTDVDGQMKLEMTRKTTQDLTDVSETGNLRQANEEEQSDHEAIWGSGDEGKLIWQLEKCNQELLALKRECERCRIVDSMEVFVQSLLHLHALTNDYLTEQEHGNSPIRESLLDFYFEISHFLYIYDLMDENYVRYTKLWEDGSFQVKLFCVNPRENLKNCMQRGRSTILFSATFLPIQYYKKLLGGDGEDYEVYAQTIFNPAKRALLIASDVTSKYTRRSQEEYDNIARYIEEIVKNRHGNYIVFCPSYAFLRIIYEAYTGKFGAQERECMIQGESMGEDEREAFLAKFRGEQRESVLKGMEGIAMDVEEEEHTLIGFCVLGGIFSEGIDLKNDSLIGAIIVGTGLPLVCDEREILKGYFDENGESGFDYAYRYPGMNKVLQAAGRVIRTVEDVGVIALLDERFLQFAYRRLFPREWETFDAVTVHTVARRVERFWDEWL